MFYSSEIEVLQLTSASENVCSTNSYSQGIFETQWILKDFDITDVKTSTNIKILGVSQKVFSTLAYGMMVSKQVMVSNDQIHQVGLLKLYSSTYQLINQKQQLRLYQRYSNVLILSLIRLLQVIQYQYMFLLVIVVKRLWKYLISLQLKMEVFILGWCGVELIVSSSVRDGVKS